MKTKERIKEELEHYEKQQEEILGYMVDGAYDEVELPLLINVVKHINILKWVLEDECWTETTNKGN